MLSHTQGNLNAAVSQVIAAAVVQRWSIWGFHVMYLSAHLSQIITLQMEALHSSETWEETPKWSQFEFKYSFTYWKAKKLKQLANYLT